MRRASASKRCRMADGPAQGPGQSQSRKENGHARFHGSDWCGWCIKLHKEVFSKPEFEEYAKKNLVLVEVDFPRGKQQTEELKKANQQLQKKYSIQGYPTLIVLNGEGTKIAESGYVQGGPKAFLADLEKKLKGKS